jgi:hypothetical protein
MLFIRRSKKLRKRQSAWLYSTVFHGAFSTFLIVFLMASFLIQPFHKAIAAEDSAAQEVAPPVAEEVKEQILEPEPTPPSEEVQQPEVAPSADESGEDATDDSGESVDVVTEEQDSDGSSIDDVVLEDTLEEAVSELPPANESGTSLTEGDLEVEDLENKKPKKEQVVEVEGLVNEDNFYQFSKQSCVAVGDGTYHCSTNTDTSVGASSVVYAERGEDGNMEIFLRTSKNKVKQITDNEYDDTSPHYDAESMKIVWQRLIDGRYQIVVFDVMEDEETQLTFSKTNNMEPKVSDAGIVWQAWDNNDWEIMFFDGSYTEQLTENDSQDVAPVIQDGYVLWNVLGGEEQQAQVYSLDTKETLSIEGYEGGAISNPRFVLVYDTKFDNGDVITQSFDPSTGLSEPIAAQPASEPINIPESDPIGEIRALISNKSKDESLLLDVEGDDGIAPPPPSDGTLNLKSGEIEASSVMIASSTLPNDTFELTEYDLVIPEGAFENALLNNASSTQ